MPCRSTIENEHDHYDQRRSLDRACVPAHRLWHAGNNKKPEGCPQPSSVPLADHPRRKVSLGKTSLRGGGRELPSSQRSQDGICRSLRRSRRTGLSLPVSTLEHRALSKERCSPARTCSQAHAPSDRRQRPLDIRIWLVRTMGTASAVEAGCRLDHAPWQRANRNNLDDPRQDYVRRGTLFAMVTEACMFRR